MTYYQELKATEIIRKAIESLQEEGQEIKVLYKEKEYIIECFIKYPTGRLGRSISEAKEVFSKSMNIVSENYNTYLIAFSFDMLGNRTQSKIKFKDLQLLPS